MVNKEKTSLALVLLWLISLAARLLVMAFVVPLDACDDSYHHWVISYWTLKIGFSRGRMWDLYGMEYYWGITPHLVEALLLFITNSGSLFVYRLFNVLISSFNTVLTYLIVKRYSNNEVAALIAGIIVAFSPFLVWETFAITEPLATFLFLLGVYHLGGSPFRAGFFFGLACTARTIFWVVSPGILAYYYLREKVTTETLPMLLGWLTPMLPYFFVLRSHTGMFYYPLYYQLLVGMSGEWIAPVPAPIWARVASYLGLAGIGAYVVYSIFRKSKFDLFITPLAFSSATHFLIYGFSASAGAVGFLGRFYLTEWAFLAILFTACIPLLIRRVKKTLSLKLSHAPAITFMILTIVVFGSLVASQTYQSGAYATRTPFDFSSQETIRLQEKVAVEALRFYRGGTIVCNFPTITYFLVQHGVESERILSSQYTPSETRNDMLSWLKKENVSLFILTRNFRDHVFYKYFPEISEERTQPPFFLVGYAERFPVFAVKLESVGD